MNLQMKSSVMAVLLVFALCLASALAQNANDLPSAPSAATQQQAQPAPAQPAPAPQPATEAKPSANDSKPPEQAQPPKPAESSTASAKPDSPATSGDIVDDEAVTTIRRRVNEVNVIFTVTDKRGRFVKNLGKNDFSVLDDNRPPAAVVNFHSESDLPLRVGLLVDASNSVRDRFKFEQESAIEFLNQIVRPRSDRAFIIGFDTTAEVTQDFTDDSEKLSRGVRMLRPGGGTALFDAV
jgi:Mg-chelatase subunit ChlD